MIAQALAVATGLWLMAAPAVLGYGGPAADSDRIIGPVAASFATMALWSVLRGVRWANLPPGAWLLAAPWILGFPPAATLNSLACGAVLIACALTRGRLSTRRTGGGWRSLSGP